MAIIRGKEISIYEHTSLEDVRGKYAWNDNWKTGGIITDGTDTAVCIGSSWYNTITGDCFFDALCINGFKVYEPVKSKEESSL